MGVIFSVALLFAAAALISFGTVVISGVVAGSTGLREDCHFTAIGWARDSAAAAAPCKLRQTAGV
jgi:hypothetical protein